MSNVLTNRIVTIKPSEPEWFTCGIKIMLKKQNRIYKNYQRNGFWEMDKVSLDIHREKCGESIERSKQNYFLNLGRKLANNRTGQKSYWKIVNNLLNKCKIPRIPPLLISDKFVTSCKEKATLFNNFFLAQCQAIPNASVLPNFHLLNIFETGIFPKQWKRANVTPVFKKQNKQLLKNYRPISLLPIFAKMFEKIILVNL